VNSQYKRVSRRRTCLICGKPDWCSYTPDAKISFCARIITNADRVSRTGWGVFYHEKSLFGEKPLPFPSYLPSKRAELAPIEIRDFAYRKLIALSPATESDEIINGPKGLRSRQILDFENYGSLPQTRAEREQIAKQIRVLINRNFPDFVRKQKSSVAGLPGFWLGKTGKVQLWSEKDYSCPMMIIPYRAASGLIQACQIRFMSRAPVGKGVRYVWMSVTDKSSSAGTGSPLHFASYSNQRNKPIIVTEGALKAGTVKKFRKEYDVLANAGVTCSHPEIVFAARFRPLFIAFDTDYHENIHVARAFARLFNLIYEDALLINSQPRIKILTWNTNISGIDEALLQNLSITTISLFEWFNSLSAKCKEEVGLYFRSISNSTFKSIAAKNYLLSISEN
jgi:hypothetical protein